jgi:hypothetical protein
VQTDTFIQKGHRHFEILGHRLEPSAHQLKEGKMAWYVYVAYFFGGAFLGNFVPHFVNGISGRKFPTPFSKPPGKGLSSPLVNVLWGVLNLVLAYLLIFGLGNFDVRRATHAGMVGLGILLIGIQLAKAFGRLEQGH